MRGQTRKVGPTTKKRIPALIFKNRISYSFHLHTKIKPNWSKEICENQWTMWIACSSASNAAFLLHVSFSHTQNSNREEEFCVYMLVLEKSKFLLCDGLELSIYRNWRKQVLLRLDLWWWSKSFLCVDLTSSSCWFREIAETTFGFY